MADEKEKRERVCSRVSSKRDDRNTKGWRRWCPGLCAWGQYSESFGRGETTRQTEERWITVTLSLSLSLCVEVRLLLAGFSFVKHPYPWSACTRVTGTVVYWIRDPRVPETHKSSMRVVTLKRLLASLSFSFSSILGWKNVSSWSCYRECYQMFEILWETLLRGTRVYATMREWIHAVDALYWKHMDIEERISSTRWYPIHKAPAQNSGGKEKGGILDPKDKQILLKFLPVAKREGER